MKKRAVLILVFVLSAVSVSAQSELSLPWDPPVPDIEAGKTLIAVGFWADVIGLGLVAGAGPAYSLDAGVANALFGLGFTSMLFIGNPALQRGLSAHHEALEEQG